MENNLQVVDGIWAKATNHIAQYLDLKKDILENNYVELLGDSIKVVGFVRNTSQLIMQKKFQSFLNGFTPENAPTEEQIKKLIEYIDDESKAEFIADAFSKILLSQSSKACLIMGTTLQSIIEKRAELSHDDLICVSALPHFFDVDITNYNFIYNYITAQTKGRERKGLLSGKKFIEEISRVGLDRESARLTIEKCVTHQLLYRINEVDLSVDDDDPSFSSAEIDEYYKITKSGETLNWHIIRCGLYM